MKNKNFFFLQYNKVNWKNQEKTRINFLIYEYITDNIILKKEGDGISVFDIGFGVGSFFRLLLERLGQRYSKIFLGGCEPSKDNFNHFNKNKPAIVDGTDLKIKNTTFLKANLSERYDFVTAIYVFPHIDFDEMEETVQKIHSLLNPQGEFILVVANEDYLKEKLSTEKDLFIERNTITYNGKEYGEVLHYSDIPDIGKIIDYNREEDFYIDLFNNNDFMLEQKEDIDDNGFLATLFVFKKT